MLRSCRYCGQMFNGELKVRDHELDSHRKQYYTDAAARERREAEKALTRAERYQSIADKEVNNG